MSDIKTRLPYFKVNKVATLADETNFVNWGISNYFPHASRAVDDGAGVTVAVMDTGLLPHPELEGRIIEHLNFADDRLTPASSPHGTHVASTIGGKSEMIGYAPKVKFIDLRVLGSNGNGSLSWTLEAGQWLLDNRDKFESLLLNCSFGFTGRNDAIEKMFRDFALARIPVFGAAGNTGKNEYFFPAAYSSVCTVGAMTKAENVANFSTKNDQVDVIAAGVGIWGAYGVDGYAEFSGTSMASPAVCGIAAVKESRKRDIKKYYDYTLLLRQSATDIGAEGFDEGSGFGRITPTKFLIDLVGDDGINYNSKVKPSLAFFALMAILIITIIILATAQV